MNATIDVRSYKARLDKKRINLRDTPKVEEIAKKFQERRWKWYGHVVRREEDYVEIMTMEMKVQ